MTACSPEDLVAILAESDTRLTARAFIRKIAETLDLTPSQAKKILTRLVNSGDLAYQDLYGSTYVMENFLKPVRLTDRFFVTPPGLEGPEIPGQINIRIHPGIAFGSGQHPTTRLCLEALDALFFKGPGKDRFPGNLAADIGTGSGILAIAACLAGIRGCTAWEIDPVSVREAEKNVAANGLEEQITVKEEIMGVPGAPLALICANLRFPTLADLAPLMKESLLPGGFLILSGLRSWEKADLCPHFTALGFSQVWERENKDWLGLVMALAPPGQNEVQQP